MGLIGREIHEGGERCSGEDLVGGPLKHPLSWKQFGSLEVAEAEDCMHSPQCQNLVTEIDHAWLVVLLRIGTRFPSKGSK